MNPLEIHAESIFHLPANQKKTMAALICSTSSGGDLSLRSPVWAAEALMEGNQPPLPCPNTCTGYSTGENRLPILAQVRIVLSVQHPTVLKLISKLVFLLCRKK